MFINDPDYVPSVFVFSSITSYKDRRSRYERLMKRRKKVAKGPHKHDHLDNVSQLSPSVQATEQDPFTEDISEDDTESIEDNVKSIEDGEDDMLAEENITTEENMDIGEDRSVTTTDKNLSTDIDANDWYAIEKRITEQQELIEMLQSELRGTRPSITLQNDDNQVHFYTGLPSYSVFIGLLKLLVGVMSKHLSHGLSHNTAKFLAAISATGAIIFISKCWGGRASDKYITSHSGFLDHLIYGDVVMADRGFDISEDLALRGTTLCIPPFTKGKSQLSQREVEMSRALSSLRIHVERAIGRIKHYKILQHTFPISLLKSTHDTEFATIDKVLIVCAALSNLQPPLV